MPYYLIGCKLRGTKEVAGVRFSELRDIERAWQYFENLAKEKFGNQLLEFFIYGLSKRSSEVKEYLAAKNRDDFKLEIPDVDINWQPPPRGMTRKERFAESRPVRKKDAEE